MTRLTYRDSGVDIDAGQRLVERIRPLSEATRRAEVLGGVGGFAALTALPRGMRDPLLVSAVDGVGTKVRLAAAVGAHDSIGVDLVAMCVNDLLTLGAQPLLFLDYLATSRLDMDVAQRVVAGIAEGCRQAGCALVGGETSEMPGMYAPGEYDIAGFALGVVERDRVLGAARVRPGDEVVGLASSGLHANGFSLARRALVDEMGMTLFDAAALLLPPTTIYATAMRAALAATEVHAAAHITGGGLIDNPPRVLPGGLAMRLRRDSWPASPLVDRIRLGAGVALAETWRVFNCGLGMVLVVADGMGEACVTACGAVGQSAWVVGRVLAAAGPARVEIA